MSFFFVCFTGFAGVLQVLGIVSSLNLNIFGGYHEHRERQHTGRLGLEA